VSDGLAEGNGRSGGLKTRLTRACPRRTPQS